MMGKLILSGGGGINDSYYVDEEYFSSLTRSAKILYIPVALRRDYVGFEICLDWFSTLISSHAKEKDIDFSMILENDKIPDLTLFDSIYIGGGNTYKLLNYIAGKKLGSALVSYLSSCPGIIYGGSAGAVVMGKDIRTVEEENLDSYTHTSGLNLLRNLSVICHYKPEKKKRAVAGVRKTYSSVLAIPEGSGLVVSKEQAVVLGGVTVFKTDNSVQTFRDKDALWTSSQS